MEESQKSALRDRVKVDVEAAIRSNSMVVQEECERVLNEVAAERGVSPAQVLRDALDQMRRAHAR